MNDPIEIPDPTRIERIISWVKIAFATKKVFMVIWAIFFGVSGTAIVGQVTDTTPIMDAAESIGIIQPRDTQEVSGDVSTVVFDEIMNLTEDIRVGMNTITEMQQEIRDLRAGLQAMQEAPVAPHSHDLPEHTHPPIDLTHEHTEYAFSGHEHDLTHTHPPPTAILDANSRALIMEQVLVEVEKRMVVHVDEVH